jgi:hypothetical protein
VPELSVKILDLVMVLLKKERETNTTEKDSILKLDTEDVLQETLTSSIAESTVDQIKMIHLPKLTLDAQENHTSIRSERLELNSESQDLTQVGYTEKEKMVNSDH